MSLLATAIAMVTAIAVAPGLLWADASPSSTWVCRSSGSTREIRLYDTGAQGCRVDYVKDGSTSTLWRASTDRRFCEARAKELAARLNRGIFRCELAGQPPTSAASGPAGVPDAVRSTPSLPASIAQPHGELTAARIAAANTWLGQRVQADAKAQRLSSGPEARRYPTAPEFLSAADLDRDGRTDLVLGWGWASYRCDGSFLTVLFNDGDDANPRYRPAEVELPGNCGAKGWLAAVKDVQSRRIHIDLRQRYPGADNVQHITASVNHGGTFTFFGPGGAAASLSAIVNSLPLKPE
ncbi:MAG: hypothetical protein U1F35_11295 [Steroidobacteraceae bacterium]